MSERRPTWAYAASGAVSACAGAAVGHLVGGVVDPAASPVLAVGSAIVDATPTPVKEWAVATFGTADKAVLLAAVAVGTLLLAAGAGIAARRSRALGSGLLVVIVAVAGVAALTRPTAGPLSVLPVLAAAGAGVAVLRWLLSRLSPPADGDIPAPERLAADRRAFLLGSGAAMAGSAALGAVGEAVGARSRGQDVAATALPRAARPLGPLPAGLEGRVPGIAPLVTPNSDFYRIDTALSVPRVDASSWRLTVDGSVEHPLTVTWQELLAMPMVEKDVTLTCVSNPVGGEYCGSARWRGVPVRTILARAGIRDDVDQVLSESVDGMTISTPVQALTDDRGALLAVAMNGEPLPPEHGFPVRLVTPRLYGFVGSTKWVVRLTATTYAAQQAYWTQRGWATDAPVITMARVDTPRDDATLRPGRLAIGGVAWAQGRGIGRVEVSIDDGPWQPARMGPEAGIDYWRQWWLPWEASAGRHTVSARATDGTGAVQPGVATDSYPKGATGYHRVHVTVT